MTIQLFYKGGKIFRGLGKNKVKRLSQKLKNGDSLFFVPFLCGLQVKIPQKVCFREKDLFLMGLWLILLLFNLIWAVFAFF